MELVIHLTEQGFNCRQYVPNSVGIADEKDRTEIKSVSDRIAALQKSDLDDADDQFLDLLQRRTVWTQRQLLLLGRIEQDYGIC